MTWHEFWTRTVLSSAVGSVISVVVGLYVRHLVKLNRDELLRIIGAVDSVATINRKGTRVFQLAQYRKAIAAGLGVMLTGLLSWVEDADLEPVLGPLVPEPFRPLVGVGLGGLATIAGVILAKNGPRLSEAPPTLEEAPPTSSLATSAAPLTVAAAATPPVDETTAATASGPVSSDAAPYWAGVRRGEPSVATSIVELLPAPDRSYQ